MLCHKRESQFTLRFPGNQGLLSTAFQMAAPSGWGHFGQPCLSPWLLSLCWCSVCSAAVAEAAWQLRVHCLAATWGCQTLLWVFWQFGRASQSQSSTGTLHSSHAVGRRLWADTDCARTCSKMNYGLQQGAEHGGKLDVILNVPLWVDAAPRCLHLHGSV